MAVHRPHSALAALVFLMGSAPCALAQEINGVPGSPGATTTIDGKQLPPLDPAFGGVIKEKASEVETLVAASRCAAQGRAECFAHHDG